MQFQLPDLPYAYNALEPHIDSQTMEIHHSKHHAGYINKLNAALEDHSDLAEKGINWLLTNLSALPEEIQTAVRNNGGGFYNHSLFWQCLSPNGGGKPTGSLLEAITQKWDSYESFQEDFNSAAASQFGSGWAWLVKDNNNELHIMTSSNQNNPIMEDASLTPILGLDVWEHAYYLNYQNRRPDYISAFWNVINWEHVNSLFSN